jgi:hypothetical protein
MRPSAAELARTLISGRVPATARLACRPGVLDVRHATDCSGRPLMLARIDDPLVRALRGRRPPTIVLQACDAPPWPDAPSLGRVLVGGTVTLVPQEEMSEAILGYAEISADPDLFEVGRGAILLQVEVLQIRLGQPDLASPSRCWPAAANGAAFSGHGWDGYRRGSGWDSADRNTSRAAAREVARVEEADLRAAVEASETAPVDLDEYLAADPDPLYSEEQQLLADLHQHHGGALQTYLAGRLAAAGLPDTTPRAVRLDRYGLLVLPYQGWKAEPVRVSFARPVRDRADLARLLHPVLFQP